MRQVKNQALTEQNPYGVKHRFSISEETEHDGGEFWKSSLVVSPGSESRERFPRKYSSFWVVTRYDGTDVLVG